MMTSVPTLHAGNVTLGHGTEGDEEALDYMESLSASSVLPSESYLGLQSTQGPSAVSHPYPEGEWVVGVSVGPAWLDILVLVLKGLVMSAVIVASVLGNLLVIVSVARYVPATSYCRILLVTTCSHHYYQHLPPVITIIVATTVTTHAS